MHEETITVPTTTSTTTPMRATPVEQWVGDMASVPRTPSRKSRRLATVGLTPVKKCEKEEISPLKQGGQLDGPNTPRKEPKPTPTPTPEPAVASTSGVGVAKKKKRGRPKKTPKAPKSTEVTHRRATLLRSRVGRSPVNQSRQRPPPLQHSQPTRLLTKIQMSTKAARLSRRVIWTFQKWDRLLLCKLKLPCWHQWQ